MILESGLILCSWIVITAQIVKPNNATAISSGSVNVAIAPASII